MFGSAWPGGRFDVVVANILRDVLLGIADEIALRLAPGGVLVLSGLVSTDVPEMIVRYASRLGERRPEIFERGPWRTLVWRRALDSGARLAPRLTDIFRKNIKVTRPEPA